MGNDAALELRNELAEITSELSELRAGQDFLASILVARGELAPGHERLLHKVRQAARVAAQPRVRLGVLRDKHAAVGPDIDCRSLLHLCQARCCTYTVELTEQDLEEGGVRWDLREPYLLRHDEDGYCTHLDRQTGGCSVYERRPATCREYDCRRDPRVWEDFERRVPAPRRAGIGPLPAAGDP